MSCIVALVSCLLSASAPAAGAPLKVGVIGLNAPAMAQAQAFSNFVQKATGKTAAASVFVDYDGLADAVAQGTVDVAFMPPIAFVRAQTKGKPEALLTVKRRGQNTYRSVLFVAAASPVKSFADLKAAKNLKAAWVDSSSAAGYIFPKAYLLANKVDPAGLFVSQDFLGSHDAVCAAVADGKADVGATFSDDPGTAAASHATGCGAKTGGVRVVAASSLIPNDALVVRAGFAETDKANLIKGARALAATPEGKKTLQAAFLGEDFAAPDPAGYAAVKQALEAFQH